MYPHRRSALSADRLKSCRESLVGRLRTRGRRVQNTLTLSPRNGYSCLLRIGECHAVYAQLSNGLRGTEGFVARGDRTSGLAHVHEKQSALRRAARASRKNGRRPHGGASAAVHSGLQPRQQQERAAAAWPSGLPEASQRCVRGQRRCLLYTSPSPRDRG